MDTSQLVCSAEHMAYVSKQKTKRIAKIYFPYYPIFYTNMQDAAINQSSEFYRMFI